MSWINDPFLEKKRFKWAVVQSVFLFLVLIIVYFINEVLSFTLNEYGIQPRKTEGLFGIIFSVFLHSNMEHLMSNIFPLTILTFGLLYYFQGDAYKIGLYCWIVTGTLTWLIGRSGVHIGASGIIYALTFFLFLVSLIKRERHLTAFTLIIVFLYGTLIWGFFPELFPDKNISWEGHLSGAIAGISAAVLFRKKGIQKEKMLINDLEADENIVYLSLGCNIGDKQNYLTKALGYIRQDVGWITNISSVYKTASWGFDAENFYNQVIEVQTKMTPFELLKKTQYIEYVLGRTEKTNDSEGYHSRTMDIDILFYENEVINTNDLIIPHPKIPFRNFILVPLTEIAPELEHPIFHKNMSTLLQESTDTLTVDKLYNA